MRSSACLRIRWWRRAPAATQALAEFLAFLRRHLFPPLPHAFSHSLGHTFSDAVTHVPFSTARASPPAKKNPAEKQQSKRLPETNEAPAEKRRQQPVPQTHYDLAPDHDKCNHREYCQRRHPNPFPSHVAFLLNL